MSNVFSPPKPPPVATPAITAPTPAPTLTEPTQADRTPQRQATRAPTNTERRIAAAQGQPNLTNVLADDTESAPSERARRRALGV